MNLNRQEYMKILSIGIVIILFVAMFTFYFFPDEPKKDEKAPIDVFVLDDRINPYIYQGLTVEILRMRNRGIIEPMSTLRPRLPSPPEFYFIVEVDGEVGDSRILQAAGGVTGSGTFNEWDTFLKECRMNFRVPVGGDKPFPISPQTTSDVRIIIMEVENHGLFGRKENYVEKLVVDLVFDYRTNHWTGDDYLGDEDGYGRVLGDEYELRFNIYASDYDHDNVPFWTEVNIFGMDPTIADGFDDPDGDGIPTWWELKYGYDPFTWDNHALLDPDLDGISNLDEYKLYKYGADPFHPDLFIEVDFMEENPNKLSILRGPRQGKLTEETKQMLIEKMAQLGISLYFDDGWPGTPSNAGGETLEFVEIIDEIVGGHMARWYKHNFPDERKGVFRYMVMGYNAGITTASEYNRFDHIVMKVYPWSQAFAFSPKRQSFINAQGILHELGHSIGLVPLLNYGVDNMPRGNIQWPKSITDEEWRAINTQYRSIMNYRYMYNVFNSPFLAKILQNINIGVHDGHRYFFEFSDGTNGEYDFDDLSNLYLPTFTMDAAIVETPDIRNLGFEEFIWTDKNPDPVYSGWELNETLTEKYKTMFCDLRFDLNNADEYLYRVYVKTDEKQKGRDVRIYTKPSIDPPTLWTLIAEADLNREDNTLEFYCFDTLFEKIIKRL